MNISVASYTMLVNILRIKCISIERLQFVNRCSRNNYLKSGFKYKIYLILK